MNSNFQLPIHHPEYQYPPASNPYWAKCKEQKGYTYSGSETEAFTGRWREQFPSYSHHKPKELNVEIGCNGGHVILEWAAARPESVFIGIDWKFKAIYRGAEKAQKRNLKNLLFFRAHGERLPYMFEEGEIDNLYLFFPDPWPKKAHWKNRFITAEKLKKLAKAVKPGGLFHIKTDHAGYFEWMLQATSEVTEIWEVIELNRNLYQFHPAPTKLQIPEVTLFERLFIRDQIPIQSLKLRKK